MIWHQYIVVKVFARTASVKSFATLLDCKKQALHVCIVKRTHNFPVAFGVFSADICRLICASVIVIGKMVARSLDSHS